MRLLKTASRVFSSEACRSITSSQVRLASSIIAQSSPRISRPASAKRSGSTWRSSLPSSGSPSEFASLLAGSIVSTATFSPCAAMPIAMAALVVVLPTPPAPAQMQMRLLLRRSAMLMAARWTEDSAQWAGLLSSVLCALSTRSQLPPQLIRQPLKLLQPQLRLEQIRQRHRFRHFFLQPPQLRPLTLRPPLLRERGPQRRGDLVRAVLAVHGLDALGLV